MPEKLSLREIHESLNKLSGWDYDSGSIKKTYKTSSYPAAMGLVAAIGGVCQNLNHHPDYLLMKFKEVEVSFSTHSEGGVTLKDIEAAGEIEKITL